MKKYFKYRNMMLIFFGIVIFEKLHPNVFNVRIVR